MKWTGALIVCLSAALWCAQDSIMAQNGKSPKPSTMPAQVGNVDVRKVQAELVANVEKLVDGLRSNRYKVRRDSQKALISLHEKYVETVLAHIDDDDRETRSRLREIIDDMTASMEFNRALSRLPVAQRGKFRQFRKQFPKVARGVFSTDWTKRVAAVRGVVELDDPKALTEPLLLLYLHDKSDDLAAAAAHAACSGQYKSDAMADALTNLLLRKRTRSVDEIGFSSSSTFTEALDAIKVIRSKRPAPTIVALMVASSHYGNSRLSALSETLVTLKEIRVIPHLLPLLGKTDVNCTYSSGNPKKITVAPSDGILITLIKLTGQNHHRYGFASTSDSDFMEGASYGFTSTEARTKAIKKFHKWWDQNKQKEQYKDLKPLKLPKVPAEDDFGPGFVMPAQMMGG